MPLSVSSDRPLLTEVRSDMIEKRVGLCVVVLIAMAILRWDSWESRALIQQTDDAYIRAEMTRLSSRVSGTVSKVAVTDYQRVHSGDLLIEIDAADYEVQVAQAEAGVASAKAVRDNLDNQIALQKAMIVQAEAQQASAVAQEDQARSERGRQEELSTQGFSPRQKIEQVVASHIKAQNDVQAARAAVEAQRRQLDVLAGTQVQRTAELRSAEAALAAARLKLGYTRVVAPFDGIVGERQSQEGDYVNAGSSLITVVPLPKVYITANYKESQLAEVSEGDIVDVTVDTFPGQTLHGRVERISPASGSQFALLPPDNATGNFTKVVQRIPVRIALDRDQPLLERLRPGMSVVTRIRTRSSSPSGERQ